MDANSKSLNNSPEHTKQPDQSSNQSRMTPSPVGLRRRGKSVPPVLTKAGERVSARPTFVVPQKDKIRGRSRRLSGQAMRTRALSPTERMRQYIARADETIEECFERLVKNVHDRAEDATVMVASCVQRLRDWKACHFEKLPAWMRDNDYLHCGHRPQLHSYAECFKSIFRIHTETGNIWTHLIGFIAFVVATIVFYVKPLCEKCHTDIQVNDKLIFLCFFVGAILCLACSTLFHTMSCHSHYVSALFSRLDYAGIALLIVGSTIPWLYYGFYCQFYARLTYIVAVSACGIITMVLVTKERFNLPDYRTYRTISFVSLAIIAALPIVHFVALNGYAESVKRGSLHEMFTMGVLYLTGAVIYASRVPERWMPGKCDIWFHSHQVFHLLVVAAAFVHYHGISEMAMHRLTKAPGCPTIEQVIATS